MLIQGILCIQFSGNIQCYIRIEKQSILILQYHYKEGNKKGVFNITL